MYDVSDNSVLTHVPVCGRVLVNFGFRLFVWFCCVFVFFLLSCCFPPSIFFPRKGLAIVFCLVLVCVLKKENGDSCT